MKFVPAAACLFLCAAVMAAPSVLQDFEKADAPKVWVVNMPNEAASATIDPKAGPDGTPAAVLSYDFSGKGQYLGMPVPVKTTKPVGELQFQLKGDESGIGLGVYINDASGETHKYRLPKVDFDGWKPITLDLSGGHETWGGDKNRSIDYPLKDITFEFSTPGEAAKGQVAVAGIKAELLETSLISVVSPAYTSDVKGDTTITVSAPKFSTLIVKCWKQGDGFGSMAKVADVKLDETGAGSFVFPADQFPSGPVTLTISGDTGKKKDNCYLQLYNRGGVAWKQGIPKELPAGAKGLDLLFADDFDGPLSIGNKPTDKYFDHKPPRGETDFSFPLRFVSHDQPNTPFAKVDSYLRIRASEKTKSAGILSSLQSDGTGFKTKVPAYFECRFIGPNAIGSWPAFWLMTDHMSDGQDKNKHQPCDELDIIEAYGGEGPKAPNAFDKYMISIHCWNQGKEGEAVAKAAGKNVPRPTEMKKVGIPSTWFEAPHTYGCLVTETETVYYCDDIEVGRHPTLPLCKEKPLFFMVNMAVGGGWPVDLSRYNGEIDMYVDFVRVYGKKE